MTAEDTDAGGTDRPGRTVATIRYELELLARRHSHLLTLCRDSHSSNDTEPAAAGCGKRKTKQRKKLLETRHASREFHGNYPIDDGDDNDPSGGTGKSGYYLALFDEFAKVVCQTAVIPRKELFEAWAMALYVHFYFPSSPEDDDTGELYQLPQQNARRKNYYKRIADMGCGHGLVSWAILFLDKSATRTAICIDKRIPKSCDIIEKVMMELHPNVVEFHKKLADKEIDGEYDNIGEEKKEDAAARDPYSTSEASSIRAKREASFKRWHWVEGDICRNISADSSTLIVGVHCCGTLSDTILDLAISSRSALALVPCCHTRKSLPREYRNEPAKVKELLAENARKNKEMITSISGNDKDSDNNNGITEISQRLTTSELLPTNITDCVDRFRIQKLTDAGFDVQEETIPSVITPKNRIIVAFPPLMEEVPTSGDTITNRNAEQFENTKKDFRIPLADNSYARSIVASQSGRLAADLRKRRPPPNLSLSLYLPDPESSMTTARLNEFSDAIALEEQHRYYPDACSANGESRHNTNGIAIIKTHVKFGSKGPYAHPEEGCYSRSYHIRYEVNDPTGKLPQVTKVQAKALHTLVCRRIIDKAFPGITLRQGIR